MFCLFRKEEVRFATCFGGWLITFIDLLVCKGAALQVTSFGSSTSGVTKKVGFMVVKTVIPWCKSGGIDCSACPKDQHYRNPLAEYSLWLLEQIVNASINYSGVPGVLWPISWLRVF